MRRSRIWDTLGISQIGTSVDIWQALSNRECLALAFGGVKEEQRTSRLLEGMESLTKALMDCERLRYKQGVNSGSIASIRPIRHGRNWY